MWKTCYGKLCLRAKINQTEFGQQKQFKKAACFYHFGQKTIEKTRKIIGLRKIFQNFFWKIKIFPFQLEKKKQFG